MLLPRGDMAKKLKGKKVVITGGAMGIGLATCKRLVKEGCDITIWDLNEPALEQARSELDTGNSKIYIQTCDVSDRDRVKELVVLARKDMGQIDILINNAGFVRPGLFWEQPIENATRHMDVNVNAFFYSIHEVLPEMLKRNSGHIVNVSSGIAFASVPGLAAYSVSKWAAWGMTDVLRLEVASIGKSGVHLTSVHPGNILTGMFEGFNLNWLGRLVFPPVKKHDTIAKGIVEAGLKKRKHLVVRPRALYIGMIVRGLVPSKLLVKGAMLAGGADAVKHFRGRNGKAPGKLKP